MTASYSITRRQFIAGSAVAGMAALSPALIPHCVAAADEYPRGSAEHCIFIWLGGGACQIDTFDPKRKGDGKKQAGSYYDAVDTAVQGVQVCAHLSRTAPL